MRTTLLSSSVALLLTLSSARASVYNEVFSPESAIPDGSQIGISFSGNVSDIPSGSTVESLTISLDISGGYNGDLYSYLVAPNGTMVVLLNQPGVTESNPFGNSGSGMTITLADGGGIISASSDLSSGTYSAAGTLANFNSAPANGTWTLYFSDLSSGGGTSILNSWTLNITAVPEPVDFALALFFSILALEAIRRFKTSRT